MRFPPDAGLARMLESFGLTPEAMLGHGGEARVYALDEQRVLRVYRAGTDPEEVDRRTALLSELVGSRERVPFSIPQVLDTVPGAGRVATVERRLPGQPLTEILRESEGDAREALVRAYLEAREPPWQVLSESARHFGESAQALLRKCLGIFL